MKDSGTSSDTAKGAITTGDQRPSIVEMELSFVNSDHERLYRAARTMLANEIERQSQDAARLAVEWERYPEDVQNEQRAWLRWHFAECRRPYEKVLTDITALCTRAVMIISASED